MKMLPKDLVIGQACRTFLKLVNVSGKSQTNMGSTIPGLVVLGYTAKQSE